MAGPASSPLADKTLERFVERLGSDAATPGSGAAAAVTLALAAGCLRKAAAITLKHRADERLGILADEAGALATAALAGAQEEAESFRALLRAASPDWPEQVLEVSEGLVMCAGAILDLADRLDGEVAEIVSGDLLAARALALAAQRIVAANAAEAEQARTAP